MNNEPTVVKLNCIKIDLKKLRAQLNDASKEIKDMDDNEFARQIEDVIEKMRKLGISVKIEEVKENG